LEVEASPDLRLPWFLYLLWVEVVVEGLVL
jgi:hypothetical protein